MCRSSFRVKSLAWQIISLTRIPGQRDSISSNESCGPHSKRTETPRRRSRNHGDSSSPGRSVLQRWPTPSGGAVNTCTGSTTASSATDRRPWRAWCGFSERADCSVSVLSATSPRPAVLARTTRGAARVGGRPAGRARQPGVGVDAHRAGRCGRDRTAAPRRSGPADRYRCGPDVRCRSAEVLGGPMDSAAADPTCSQPGGLDRLDQRTVGSG